MRFICITVDKIYKNNDQENYFKETDPLGGYDPIVVVKQPLKLL